MSTDSNSADISPLVARNEARRVIRDALRLYVGRGRRYSVKQLSNGTGVPDRSIDCAIADPDSTEFRPLTLEALFSIGRFLGSSFTNEWMPNVMGQGAFDLPDGEEPDPARMSADAAEDTATIARAAADGVFDRDEKRHLSVVGRRKIERGMQLVASAARAA